MPLALFDADDLTAGRFDRIEERAHALFRKRFLLISLDPEEAFTHGIRVRLWDFLFDLARSADARVTRLESIGTLARLAKLTDPPPSDPNSPEGRAFLQKLDRFWSGEGKRRRLGEKQATAKAAALATHVDVPRRSVSDAGSTPAASTNAKHSNRPPGPRGPVPSQARSGLGWGA